MNSRKHHNSTLCIHCLAPLEEPTRDHLFPSAWFPATTPPDVQRPVVPSCGPCNNRMGAIENRLRSRIVLALDPTTLAAQGLVRPVHRAINPASGKDQRDREARAHARSQLFGQTLRAIDAPSSAILPGLGPDPSLPLHEELATLVRADDLEAFVHKLVRGLSYLDTGAYIVHGSSIELMVIDGEVAEHMAATLDRFGSIRELGPGFKARIARESRNPVRALYEFTIWQRLVLYSKVDPKDRPGSSDQQMGDPDRQPASH